MRSLSPQQLVELREAQEKEVNNCIRNHAVKAGANKYDIPVAELMKMRWVTTIKEYRDGNNKVKARLCILGTQDPNVEDATMDVGTLTPHQRTRHVFLSELCVATMEGQKGRRGW